MNNSRIGSHSWLQRVFNTPTDAASVAVFRIGFGIIMAVEAFAHLGFYCLDCYYVEPSFFFKYFGFEWVPALREGIYPLYAVLGFAGIMVALGLYYRIATIVLLLGMAWIFLQDQALYLNHIYLVLLYCTLMCILPAHRYWSLDAKLKPEIATNVLPSWCRLLLICQIEIILIYAGLVKINPDWLQLEPLATWLAYRTEMGVFSYLFQQPWAVAFAAYGVILLHLVGAPLLLHRTARYYVLGVYASFHLLNHFVFDIGIFPWVTWFASLICLDPDWPRKLWARLRKTELPAPLIPTHSQFRLRTGVVAFCIFWLLFQTLYPLRNLAFAGNVGWNEAGHRFSWRMKLRSKRGIASFEVKDPESGQRWRVNPERYLIKRQKRKFVCRPDMVLQFAHHLRDIWQREKGVKAPEVYANIRCSLNYRRLVPFVDKRVDLAKQPRTFGHYDWVLPLDEPLNPKHLPWIAQSSSEKREN